MGLRPLARRTLNWLCSVKARLRSGDLTLGSKVAISWSAVICNRGSVTIGSRSTIRMFAVIQPAGGSVSVGEQCSVGLHCVLDGSGGLSIGDSVRIGPGARIFSSNHRFDRTDQLIREQGLELGRVVIADDVWIGSGATILAGTSVGRGAVIAAGAVVTKDVGELEVWGGVPAKKISART